MVLADNRSARTSLARDISYSNRSNFFAANTTWSGSKPKCFWSSFRGAEAPNVFMPMTTPDGPTYRSHPRVEALLHRQSEL